MNSPLIISISGIRGIVGESLTADVVHRFAAAYATTLKKGERVVIARDTRPSGAEFAASAAAALSTAGCTVVDCGVCTTPAAKLMVLELQAGAAIIITASHNPSDWNGLKLVRSDGIFLNTAQASDVEARFQSGDQQSVSGGSISVFDPSDVARIHTKRVLQCIDVEAIRRANFRVVVDPCNGTGATNLPDLLTKLGVTYVFINEEPNGEFAHEPEPVPVNLLELGDAVRNYKADIGFAVDPDADRVALVGVDGSPLGEDLTLALAVTSITNKRQGPVVTTLSTSQTVTDAATRNNCPVYLTPVGEVHVVEKMLAESAVIGGEGNGGVILTEVDPGRDAAVGIAVILEAMATQTSSLESLVNSLPSYFIEKRKIACRSDQLDWTVAAIRERHASSWIHPVSDGYKLYLTKEQTCPWIHLRASNTEPFVRIIAETESQDRSRILCDETEDLIRKSP